VKRLEEKIQTVSSLMRSLLKPFLFGFLPALFSLVLSACNPNGETTIDLEFHPNVELSYDKSSLAVSNSQVASGSTVTVTLSLYDTNGKFYISKLPVVAFSASGGTSTGTFSSVAQSDTSNTYTATFTGVTAGTATTISATVDGKEISSALPSVQVVSGAVSLSRSVVSVGSSSVFSTETTTVTLTAKDSIGNQLSSGGLTVAFSTSGGTSTGTFSSVTDNGNGTYSSTFTGAGAGSATSIRATISSQTITSTLPTILVSSTTTATQIVLSSGNSQTGTAGSALGSPLVVVAKDVSNNIVYGATVDWVISSGGGSLSAASSLSNGSGLASSTLTLGSIAGANSVTATLHGTSSTVTFTATGNVGAASKLSFTTSPSSTGTAGSALSTQPVVTVQDSNGNTVTSSSASVVLAVYSNSTCTTAAATTPSGAISIGGTATVAASSGVSTFTGISVNKSGTTLYVRASSGSLTTACSSAMNISATAFSLTQSALTVSSSSVASGSTLTATLTAKDTYGNPSPSGVTAVTFASTPLVNGTGTFGSTTNAGSGVYTAVYTGVTAGTATLSGLINSSSISSTQVITISVGAASQIVATSGTPQSAFLGAALGSAMVVNVKDANNNNVSGVTINWTTSNGTLGSGASTTTAANGNTSNTLTLGTGSTAGGAQSVGATINGTGTSATFSITANVATPTGLAGTNANAASSLTWTATTGATSYKIYRSTTSGSGYTLVNTSMTNAYSDSGLTNGTPYYYVVSALNNSAESSQSSEATVTPVLAPGAPTSLAGTLASSQTVLTWTAPSTGTAPFTYKVYRSTSSGSGYSNIATTGSGVVTYTDTGISNGTTYYYVVTALNGSVSGESTYSNEIAVTPDYVPTLAYDFLDASSFQPQNLLYHSQTFNTSSWFNTGTTRVLNATVAPNGTFTATKVVETSATSAHSYHSFPTFTAGLTYTYSIYAKKSENRYLQIFLSAAAFPSTSYANYDLQSGVVTATGSGTISSIHNVGNGWYRCVLTATASLSFAGATTGPYLIQSGTDARGVSYAGTTGNGVFVWGPQLEVNPGVSRYVATTSAQASSFTSPLTPTFGSTALTFARADTVAAATVYGSDGKLRRAPHNVAVNSEQATLWANQQGITITSDTSLAPDGTMTADLIVPTATTSTHHLESGVFSAVAGKIYTVSAYFKSGGITTLSPCLAIGGLWANSQNPGVTIDLSTGAITASNNIISSGISPAGNNWYRVWFTQAAISSGTSALRSRDCGTTWTGDGVNGWYVWGVQVEENVTPSSYLATTSSTRFNSPRFDYNPTTLAPRGLLMEESRANGITRSEEFDNASWTKSLMSYTANVAIAPDGTTTAEKFVEDTSAGIHRSTNPSFSATAGTTYTGSIFLKASERTLMTLQLTSGSAWPGGSNPVMNVNLTACTIGTTTNVLSSTAQSVGNGWCRFSLTQTISSSASTGINIILRSGSGSTNYTGDGTSGAFVWGAQFEAGSFPTSYIPTTSAAVTRSFESNSLSSSGWLQASSTWFIDFITGNGFTPNIGSVGNLIRTNDSGNAYYRVRTDTVNRLAVQVVNSSGGLDANQILTSSLTTLTNYRLGFTIAPNDVSSCYNGSSITSSTTGTPMSASTFYFGTSSNINNENFNGWYKYIKNYGSRIPDTDMQRLTQ
jgi:hypothetical protein